jgi:hypothetical protein
LAVFYESDFVTYCDISELSDPVNPFKRPTAFFLCCWVSANGEEVYLQAVQGGEDPTQEGVE